MSDPAQRIPFASGGLLADEDVLPQLERWLADGQRAALVTLVDVEGGAPREAGAQMAVNEAGCSVGYLSGGCLEDAVVLEAQSCIREQANKLIRYGKGSPYFDIRLPCGSGLDIYIDQSLQLDELTAIARLRADRRPFILRIPLSEGRCVVEDLPPEVHSIAISHRKGDTFERVYMPPVHLLLLGNGPGLSGITALAGAIGIGTTVWTTDDASRSQVAQTGATLLLDDRDLATAIAKLDFASAAVLVFHEHEREIDALCALLDTPCFYLGALGNHRVHRERLAALNARGVGNAACQRIRAPVGSIPGAKSKAALAVSVIAELMGTAKSLNLMS
jgi:xanthine dehydrogenase accessory factor